MNLNALLKQVGTSVVVLGLAVGCGSEPVKEEPATIEPAPIENNEAKTSAENAIFDAKQTAAEADSMGASWVPTSKLLADADKAMAAGDYEKAKMLADEAKAQAKAAIDQANAESEKLAAEQASMAAAADESEQKSSMLVSSYTVVKGDSLWRIAAMDDIYGNPYQWPLIYKANAASIKDPDLIFPNQVLDINQNPLSEEVEAAISHAKNRGAWTIGAVEESDSKYLSK
jgi:nucleoid-associated protein YgaU